MSDHRHSAGDPGAVGHDGRTFDPERTVGGDADLLAEVRSAVEAARRGLAAPPGSTPPSTGDAAADEARGEDAGDDDTVAVDAIETAGASPTAEMAPTVGDPSALAPTLQLPQDPAAPLPPPADPGLAPPAAAGFGPPAVAGTEVPTTVMAATSPDPTEVLPVQGVPTAQQRWVPPPRLKPAATPTPAAFVDEPPARRGRAWWIVGAAAVVVAAGVGIAFALSGGDPAPSDDTAVSVPADASTTVVSPTTASATTARPTTTRPATTTATTAAPTTAAPTTAPPTTAAPSTEAPTTPPPETVAPEPPPETTPPAPGG